MIGMTEDKDLLIAALIRKLGGEVLITPEDLNAAGDLEVQKSQDEPWVGIKYRVRPAPVTLSGEVVSDPPAIEEALNGG